MYWSAHHLASPPSKTDVSDHTYNKTLSLLSQQVYPYKSEVIRGLAPCLDDKKRLVRKAAVKSRSEW